MDPVEAKREFKGKTNSFLRCRSRDGDSYLVPVIHALVKDEGTGRHGRCGP